MCSAPVTLGGGMTMQNGGFSELASARKQPASFHASDQRRSTSVGS